MSIGPRWIIGSLAIVTLIAVAACTGSSVDSVTASPSPSLRSTRALQVGRAALRPCGAGVCLVATVTSTGSIPTDGVCGPWPTPPPPSMAQPGEVRWLYQLSPGESKRVRFSMHNLQGLGFKNAANEKVRCVTQREAPPKARST